MKIQYLLIAVILLALPAFWVTWFLLPQEINGNSKPDSVLTAAYLGNGLEEVLPLPKAVELDPRKVELGELLFHDPTLSGNGFSCATCHPVDQGGMDGLALSLKTGGGSDVMNTPTVFNTGFNSLLLWNGEARSLEQQLDGVINNPLHMNSSWPKVLQSISTDQHYVAQFQEIYQAPLHEDQVMNAIATFERSLVTPNSDFDRYLRGDELALTEKQKLGFLLFKQYGCISCHQGINLGGNLFAKFGIYKLENKPDVDTTPFHLGQYLYTKEIGDRYVFRVPSLRNIAVTAPYFHDGSAGNLQEAIKTMALTQLDIVLSEDEITHIESFLNSLTGEYQGRKL